MLNDDDWIQQKSIQIRNYSVTAEVSLQQ
uniref:Uncharacterized protein n=1 Tax=Arundo donax TaxID=35708 RepID=A0A0A8ZXY9_ARUDO